METAEATDRKSAYEVLDVEKFKREVIEGYNRGTGPQQLPADLDTARSLIPAATGALRDFSHLAPEIPEFIPDKCVGCMECVTQCPDTAILGKVNTREQLDTALENRKESPLKAYLRRQYVETTKYTKLLAKKGQEPGLFGIFIDPTKCKGCAECVEVCGEHGALRMIDKGRRTLQRCQQAWDFFGTLPATDERYVNERVLIDMMLKDEALLYVGGAGSCAGCGEATALRMLMAALGSTSGATNVGLVAATGCNTVYTSAYPYNPYVVPWSNSLFENVATFAMGVRVRWDQIGWREKRLWAIGGDGALFDIGFQALSRMLASGMDIKVLVLDTQVYSNTGGQASTSSYLGQRTKMSPHGSEIPGKTEQRKELGLLCLMHKDVFVAQTTCAHVNHFYRAILAANEYPGPAVVIVYTTCQPEHGVADHLAAHQAQLAVDSRTFPLVVHDPRKGKRLRERVSLAGNPSVKTDWYEHPKLGRIDFISFARSEGRFAKHFDKDGNSSETLMATQQDRLQNWRTLQEMAGVI